LFDSCIRLQLLNCFFLTGRFASSFLCLIRPFLLHIQGAPVEDDGKGGDEETADAGAIWTRAEKEIFGHLPTPQDIDPLVDDSALSRVDISNEGGGRDLAEMDTGMTIFSPPETVTLFVQFDGSTTFWESYINGGGGWTRRYGTGGYDHVVNETTYEFRGNALLAKKLHDAMVAKKLRSKDSRTGDLRYGREPARGAAAKQGKKRSRGGGRSFEDKGEDEEEEIDENEEIEEGEEEGGWESDVEEEDDNKDDDGDDDEEEDKEEDKE
jgi:hypothetical protein